MPSRRAQGAPGCLLTANGKIQAWFWLWQIAPDRFGFELDAGTDGKWRSLFIETIEQLHFAEKFTLTEPAGAKSHLRSFRMRREICPGRSRRAGWRWPARHALLHHGTRDFGRAWITAWGTAAALDAVDRPAQVSFAELETWRIGAVRPRVEAEIDENAIPLEVGLVDALATTRAAIPARK